MNVRLVSTIRKQMEEPTSLKVINIFRASYKKQNLQLLQRRISRLMRFVT